MSVASILNLGSAQNARLMDNRISDAALNTVIGQRNDALQRALEAEISRDTAYGLVHELVGAIADAIAANDLRSLRGLDKASSPRMLTAQQEILEDVKQRRGVR